jgi:hypothetical protein
MTQKQSTTIVVVTVLAVVCIILACLTGLFVGGVGGRLAGAWANRSTGPTFRNRFRATATPAQPRRSSQRRSPRSPSVAPPTMRDSLQGT